MVFTSYVLWISGLNPELYVSRFSSSCHQILHVKYLSKLAWSCWLSLLSLQRQGSVFHNQYHQWPYKQTFTSSKWLQMLGMQSLMLPPLRKNNSGSFSMFAIEFRVIRLIWSWLKFLRKSSILVLVWRLLYRNQRHDRTKIDTFSLCLCSRVCPWQSILKLPAHCEHLRKLRNNSYRHHTRNSQGRKHIGCGYRWLQSCWQHWLASTWQLLRNASRLK